MAPYPPPPRALTGTTWDFAVRFVYWCFLATYIVAGEGGGSGQTMLPPPWKELIPFIFSGQWLSSDVMGWGVKLWMKKHSVDDADYSSLLPPERLLSGGISHQRDEDWITLRGKISRLQAWYHHLDYGLDLGFPNFLKSTISHLSL